MTKKSHLLIAALVAGVLLAGAGYLLTAYEKQPPNQVRPISPATNTKAADAASPKISTPKAEIQATENTDRQKAAKSSPVAAAAPGSAPSVAPLAAEELRSLVAEFFSYRHNATPEAIDALTTYLDHSERLVAAEALDTLAYIARDGVERAAILATLKEKAMEPFYALRGKALYMATMVDPDEMLPIIGDFINDPRENSQAESYVAAVRALTIQIGPQSLPYVDALLEKNQDSGVRRTCFEILAKIDSPQAMTTLQAQILKAKDQDQTAGVAALARLENPEVIDFLTNSIQAGQFHQETIDRMAYSPTAPEVFGRLLKSETLTDTRKIELLDTLAGNAVTGNQQLRVEMTDVMADLAQESPNPEIKSRAIKVIGALGAKSAPAILEAYLVDADPAVRKEAFFTFMDYASPFNYTVLHDFLWDEDEQVRRTAMASLGAFAVEDDIEILTQASQHEDEFIRKHAIALLDQLKGKE